jgi:hypothetical protein
MSSTTHEPTPSDTGRGVWGGSRERRPRPSWLVPAGALVAGLVIGGAGGFLLHRPESEVRTVVREREVEVTPESCLRALDMAELALQDLGETLRLIDDFVAAVTTFDVQRTGELIGEAAALGARVRDHTSGLLPAINECRQQARSPG